MVPLRWVFKIAAYLSVTSSDIGISRSFSPKVNTRHWRNKELQARQHLMVLISVNMKLSIQAIPAANASTSLPSCNASSISHMACFLSTTSRSCPNLSLANWSMLLLVTSSRMILSFSGAVTNCKSLNLFSKSRRYSSPPPLWNHNSYLRAIAPGQILSLLLPLAQLDSVRNGHPL